MAITAPTQSALSDLSWDETIVPTLKKRLEIESRTISKRMSTISIDSGEDGARSYSQKAPTRPSGVNGKTAGRVTPTSMNSEQRPTAIPRPSLNYSRPSTGSASATASHGNDRADMKRPSQPRARTYSQPFRPDATRASNVNGSSGQSHPSTARTTNALPTPASSRSNSPVLPPSPALQARDARSTKTPANKRADQNGRNQSLHLQEEYDNQERWDADEDTFDASYSSIRVPQTVKQNGILHEAPPFSANSSFASEIDERPSLEERPYEHWYRGDLSRNGGVGELRIGSRMEMLEIASYGHKLRTRNDTFSRQRRRAQSIGHRESVIFAEEHDSLAVPMVLDEAPLTDMEADSGLETDREQSFAAEEPIPLEQPKRTNNAGSTVVLPSTPKHRQPTQIPRVTPRTAQRTASEPLHSKSLSSSTSSTMTPSRTRSPAAANGMKIPNSYSQPLTSTPAQKRGRVKSPGPGTPASKKPRPSAAQQKRSKSTGAAERLRPKEPSEYPAVPDGLGSMADAIPSWTQPKKAGNWDDVVLPAVARKMGLEDQYEEADGSPKALRPPSEEVAPPQPGTFAFDASKRRLRYDPATGEHIPMEEFDRAEIIEEDPDTSPSKMMNNGINDTRMSKRFSTPIRANGGAHVAVDESGFKQKVNRYSPPPSPAPFVQYKAPGPMKPEPGHEMATEQEKNAGCCGCIIM